MIPLLVVILSDTDDWLSQSTCKLVGKIHASRKRADFSSIFYKIKRLKFVAFHFDHKLSGCFLKIWQGIKYQLHLLLLVNFRTVNLEIDAECLPLVYELNIVGRLLLARAK